jgi:hypothetical protein
MDGFSKIRTIAKAATANVEVSPAAKSNEMDIEPAVEQWQICNCPSFAN